MKNVLSISLFFLLSLAFAFGDAAKDRKAARAVYKDGNYKEALELYEELLNDVSDQQSGSDLNFALNCLQNINQHTKKDELVEKTLKGHVANFYVHEQAARYYLYAQHYGSIIDEKFIRTSNKGQRVNTQARDRTRALQLFAKAESLIETSAPAVGEHQVASFYFSFASAFAQNSQNFKFQALTDLSELPDYEKNLYRYGWHHHSSGGTGAPTTKDGDPVFYSVPKSFEAAANDGERWRYLLRKAGSTSQANKNTEIQTYADFLQRQFGVQTLRTFSWFSNFRMDPENQEKNEILALFTLKDSETTARLASGVKRFTMPEEHNHILLYQQLFELGHSDGITLANIYLNRLQFDKAVAILQESLAKRQNKNVERLLDDIIHDWARFDTITSSFVAGKNPSVGIVFRNAKAATLKVSPIDMAALYQDTQEMLKGNPLKLDWNDLNLSGMSQRLQAGRLDKYIGKALSVEQVGLNPRPKHWDTRADLSIPVKEAGAYVLTLELENGKSVRTVIWLDALTLVSHNTKKGTLYTVTDSISGAPVPNAKLSFFGYRQEWLNKRKLLRRFNVFTDSFERATNKNGQLVLPANGFENQFNWSIEISKGEHKIYRPFNRISNHFNAYGQHSNTRHFAITDRPVYLPKQTVYGKFWYRNARYDQPDTSVYANQSFQIVINDPQGQQMGKPISTRSDEYGGIEYEINLPEDCKLGVYQVQLRQGNRYRGNHTFRVEKYKKPEFEVLVESPSEPVKLGETFEAIVRAKYYHGAPVSNAKVKVKVMRHHHDATWFPAGPWDWLYGGGYGWHGEERYFYPGFAEWGCRCPSPFWIHRPVQQPEVVLEQEFDIEEDGTVKVKIDSSLAKQVFGDKNQRYAITAEVVDASRRTIVGSGSTLATAKPFQVTVWLDRGHVRLGERVEASISAKTLDGKAVEAKGTTTLYSVSVDSDGKIHEEKVKEWKTATGKDGSASQLFTCDKAGQYKISSVLTDKKGNEIKGATFITIRGDGIKKGNYAYNAIEITLDKRSYAPGDTAEILVKTKRRNSHVTVFLKGGETFKQYQLDGQTTLIKLPITLADMPNTFVNAFTVSDGKVHSAVKEVIIPPAKRVLNIEVVSDKKKYKPREEGTISVKVTDSNGKPVVGSLALSIYDKSLEYISGGSNVGNIKETYWKWRRHYYSQLQHSAGRYEYSIVPRGKRGMPNLGAFGHMVGDMQLKGDFGAEKKEGLSALNEAAPRTETAMDAASVAGAPMAKSRAAQAGRENAGIVPAAPEIMVRNKFADLVKWQGNVMTDKDGVATVPVTFPDNLTTWKIKTWGVSHGTKVGEGSAEVITSKDLIIRLQAPRYFVEKDEVTLSAVVHNYHEKAFDAKVSLSLKGGTVEATSPLEHHIRLKAKNGEERIDWNTKVLREGKAVVRMTVVTSEDSDAMEMTFPVYVHGILKQEAWSRVILPNQKGMEIELNVPEERKPEESRLEVRYSPTIAGSIISALPYLSEYPYGCTEQTLNRFVPTVVCQKLIKDLGVDLEAVRNQRANLNPQELGDDKERMAQWQRWQRNPVFDEAEVAKMTAKGVERLIQMQNSDGGWGWFSGFKEVSYPHTTAVVVHGLQYAKMNGAKVPQEMINRGLNWLKRFEEKEVAKLKNAPKEIKPWKHYASNLDALVRFTLAEAEIGNEDMLGFLFRDKLKLSVYGKSLVGLSLHIADEPEKRDEVIRNIEQFLIYDDENQTAYLNLRNSGYWWNWYGSEFEAQAWYLRLLARTNPKSKQARGLVKYLVNNRKHATYWNSTRDTAYCIEAIAEYLKASGEFNPEATVEVLFDGKLVKTVSINKENLFSYDNKFTIAGDVLSGGKHKVEVRRKGEGPLYTNTYLTYFTKEDFITKAGLEVKVERRYYKLTPDKDATAKVAGSHGQVVNQKVEKYKKTKLKSGDTVKSGDLIEVELIIESKNDYEYLMFADYKPAGCENKKVRSGYIDNGIRAYMEIHDEKAAFFVRHLPRGKHNLTYQLRAEIPGKFSALPTQAEAMYAPELRANSDEIKLRVIDK